mmetsp:Transcript_9852/g.25847  ORF Transcript_9852/g.25847 Transcript_9852/m.25847 type:complete len:206 (-) Transcript_9852:7-624(-)
MHLRIGLHLLEPLQLAHLRHRQTHFQCHLPERQKLIRSDIIRHHSLPLPALRGDIPRETQTKAKERHLLLLPRLGRHCRHAVLEVLPQLRRLVLHRRQRLDLRRRRLAAGEVPAHEERVDEGLGRLERLDVGAGVGLDKGDLLLLFDDLHHAELLVAFDDDLHGGVHRGGDLGFGGGVEVGDGDHGVGRREGRGIWGKEGGGEEG